MVIQYEADVYIPHLGYTVYLRSAEPEEYEALTQKVNEHESVIYIRLPLYDEDIPYLCHEIMHVIQYICQDYGINLKKEQEHIAYLFQYILTGFMQ